jgi:hypothetical protein
VLIEGLDFFFDIVTGSMIKTAYADKSKESGSVMMCYLSVIPFWCFIWALQTNRHFSAVMTIGALAKCLGLMIVAVKIHSRRSVKGLSSQMLVLIFVYLIARLTCTSLQGGYIPTDKSGQLMYQLCDTCSLVIVAHLLYSIHKTYAHTFDDEHDNLPIVPMMAASAIMAVFVHSWLNRCPIFDTVWMVSLNVETLVLLPQINMVKNNGFTVCGLTKHFVSLWIASRVCFYVFWCYAYEEVISQAPKEEVKDPHIAAWYIMGCYVFQLVLCGGLVCCCAEAWLVEGKETKKRNSQLIL